VKKYILFDHDGVLVETEQWYYLANKRALASLEIDLQLDAYLMNMTDGVSVCRQHYYLIPELLLVAGRRRIRCDLIDTGYGAGHRAR
jgi:beta-phosphoglucomutase-like phosphatase (HAD superfamily)